MSRLREFEVEIEYPVSIASKGELYQETTVLLTGPTSKNRREASRIKGACMAAIKKAADGISEAEMAAAQAKSEGATMKASDLMNVMSQVDSDGELMAPLYDAFRDMLLQGCGTIRGEKITISIFDQLALEDLEKLFGEYAINFLLNSLLNSKPSRDGSV